METQTNELKTPEEAAAYRQQLIAEMAAEERGEDVPAIDTENTKVLPDTKPGPETDPPAEDPDKNKTVDPWEGVNPALKNMFDNMSARVENLSTTETRLKQAESRIGALTNELHAAKTAAAETSKAPTEKQMADASATTAKWDELKEDYPDWAEAIESRLAIVNKKEPTTPGITQEALQEAIKSVEGKSERTAQVAVLEFAHPDYESTINSKEYQEWLKIQPVEIVQKTKSVRAVDAIEVLDRYTEATASSEPSAAQISRQRRNRLETAVKTPGRRSPAPKSEADMSEQELRASIGKEVFSDG